MPTREVVNLGRPFWANSEKAWKSLDAFLGAIRLAEMGVKLGLMGACLAEFPGDREQRPGAAQAEAFGHSPSPEDGRGFGLRRDCPKGSGSGAGGRGADPHGLGHDQVAATGGLGTGPPGSAAAYILYGASSPGGGKCEGMRMTRLPYPGNKKRRPG